RAENLPAETQKLLLERARFEMSRPDGLRVACTLDRAPDSPRPEGSGPGLLPELVEEGFPAIPVPSLDERKDDLRLLIERFLAEGLGGGRKPPRLTEDGLDEISRHHFLDGLHGLRAVCTKLSRFGGDDAIIGAGAVRTILTPTLRIARQK